MNFFFSVRFVCVCVCVFSLAAASLMSVRILIPNGVCTRFVAQCQGFSHIQLHTITWPSFWACNFYFGLFYLLRTLNTTIVQNDELTVTTCFCFSRKKKKPPTISPFFLSRSVFLSLPPSLSLYSYILLLSIAKIDERLEAKLVITRNCKLYFDYSLSSTNIHSHRAKPALQPTTSLVRFAIVVVFVVVVVSFDFVVVSS